MPGVVGRQGGWWVVAGELGLELGFGRERVSVGIWKMGGGAPLMRAWMGSVAATVGGWGGWS